jgi:Holliday junction resolvase RusA-like endonuclease
MPHIYILEGNPIPCARPRINKTTLHIYDSQKQERIRLKLELERQHNDRPFYKGPLALYATFFLPIPKSLSVKNQNLLNNTYRYNKPDLDNVLKFLLDLSSDILFQDDAQVAVCSIKKIYSKEPRTEFFIEELKKDDI